MKKRTQKQIAQEANISEAFFCEILAGKKTPSWVTAKKLSKITGISIELWMESKNNPEKLKDEVLTFLSENTNSVTQKHSTVEIEQFKEQNNICQQEAQ